MVRLGSQERAVLSVLVANQHRVISRGELSKLAGLEGLSERRCDSVLVQIRRYLGPESVTTVRGRGWRLSAAHVEAANVPLAEEAGPEGPGHEDTGTESGHPAEAG